ncbi:hypothetical protein [Pyxidicoccus xibeiensis]|uniref:hypothetical protein n=1 Tax=Pyxidicoccus xibeiensis TaxID=2906759 RepID=UPI0020A76992|nr:hypothetical protein [Pyxidicoccus xibeiensis]MCP3144369.1 hypothetical protein [Pyxidicoccus xibeiensis]
MQRVCVLYEDQRGPRQGFGLHALVKACVADGLASQERHFIEAALRDYRPLKGYANVLKACREELEDIAPDGRPVIAVFDNDKIRHLLKLAKTAPDERVEQEIRKGSPPSGRLSIVLLKQNMESVLTAAHACYPSIDPKRIELATVKKDLLERDAILSSVTSEQLRAVRDCILQQLPSFRALVDLLCRHLQASSRTKKKR